MIGFTFVGWFCDKNGHRITFMFISAACLFIGYSSVMIISPVICLSFLGVAYAIFGAVLTPMVIYLAPHRIAATVLGFGRVIRNATMILFPLVSAYLTVNF